MKKPHIAPTLASALWRAFLTGNKRRFHQAVSALGIDNAATSLVQGLVAVEQPTVTIRHSLHLFLPANLRAVPESECGSLLAQVLQKGLIYTGTADAWRLALATGLLPALKATDIRNIDPTRIPIALVRILIMVAAGVTVEREEMQQLFCWINPTVFCNQIEALTSGNRLPGWETPNKLGQTFLEETFLKLRDTFVEDRIVYLSKLLELGALPGPLLHGPSSLLLADDEMRLLEGYQQRIDEQARPQAEESSDGTPIVSGLDLV